MQRARNFAGSRANASVAIASNSASEGALSGRHASGSARDCVMAGTCYASPPQLKIARSIRPVDGALAIGERKPMQTRTLLIAAGLMALTASLAIAPAPGAAAPRDSDPAAQSDTRVRRAQTR